MSGVGDSIKSWFSPGFREEQPAAGDQEQEKKEGEEEVWEIIMLSVLLCYSYIPGIHKLDGRCSVSASQAAVPRSILTSGTFFRGK